MNRNFSNADGMVVTLKKAAGNESYNDAPPTLMVRNGRMKIDSTSQSVTVHFNEEQLNHLKFLIDNELEKMKTD